MHVSEIMRSQVECCHPDDTLAHAAGKMWSHDVGALPVVDDDGRAVGMITDRDIAMAAYHSGQPLAERRVENVYTGRLYSVHPDDSLAKAEQAMSGFQVRRLPVVNDDGAIVGIVSLNDIARATRETPGRSRPSAWEVARTLQAVGERRSTMTPAQA